jgi:glycosyltransferase involved in cell wall biosynthesis
MAVKRNGDGDEVELQRSAFDADYYLKANPDVAASGLDPLKHFLRWGWKEGRDPSPWFRTREYLEGNPEVAGRGENPFLHWLRDGRQAKTPGHGTPGPGEPAPRREPDPTEPERTPSGGFATQVGSAFDEAFYAASFGPGEVPPDLLGHYLSTGWREGRDPTPWFSVRGYLAIHPDVEAAGVEPFTHYITHGRAERRKLVPDGDPVARVYAAHAAATAPGRHFEEVDPRLGEGASAKAKVLAYYLPQFHAIPENDRFWGPGFTEWRNLPRGLPRFEGHVQPKLPRDLGHYDLSDADVLRRQAALARQAGIHGFCFYHYWFDRKRVLAGPVERLLADPALDMPFCLMWANENWTRTWDGFESDILLQQSYRPEDDEALVDDLARHFADPRYIRLSGRPLFFIYRPGHVPDAAARIQAWRELLRSRHGLAPLIFMAQGFGDLDPRPHGLDGAIEFPPHKLAADLPDIRDRLPMLDPSYRGTVLDWDAVVARSLSEPEPGFPLIRTVVPQWDNEARRPGRGFVLHGSTPAKFGAWLARMIAYTQAHRIQGEAIVAVNAWNEWAEGAVLEPDLHHGGAYLNAVARAVFGRGRPPEAPRRVLLLGHDAERGGAQVLLLAIAETLQTSFGIQAELVLGAGGPLLERFRAAGPVQIIAEGDQAQLARHLRALAAEGVDLAIANTVVTGWALPELKRSGFRVLSLLHEMSRVIRARRAEGAARHIAALSDHVLFPGDVVRDAFLALTGPAAGEVAVRPQGLFNAEVAHATRSDAEVRAELGFPPEAALVICVAYGDLRKGVDRFVAAAVALCSSRSDVCFAWVGPLAPELADWVQADVDAQGLSGRIRFVDYTQTLGRWYAAADVFLLSSREDPFPSVVLEALAAGLPVVGFRGTGGCDALIARHGRLVDAADPRAAAEAIELLLDAPAEGRAEAAAARRAEVARNFDFVDYCFDLVGRLDPDLASVSAIVPLFNYERHVAERLRSVFHQSQVVREVIVLDDASRDGSVAAARREAEQARRTISLSVNAANTGSPFAQWRKGLALAQGEFVWIAEADDVADPAFLQRVLGRMRRCGAAIGFSDSWQIGPEGEALGPSYAPYNNELAPGAFDESFDMEGPEFLARFLSVKNVILNVSAAVIRRDALVDAMDRAGPALGRMQVAGDWRVYMEICAAGGRVSYVAQPLNGHRRHPSSVTHSLKADRHLQEIAAMQDLAGRLVDLPATARRAQADYLRAVRASLGLPAGT